MNRFSRDTRRGLLAGLLILLSVAWLIGQLAARKSPDGSPGPAASILPPEFAYSLYFTNPGGPGSSTLRGGPDAALAAAIDAAERSVDLAMYQFDLWSIRDAMIRAHRRGVAVRVVTDNESLEIPEVRELVEEGIPLTSDADNSLMHHKFVIIDRSQVWTGSMNLTVTGAYFNNNNLIMLRSSEIAELYRREFEEMYQDQRYGVLSSAGGIAPPIEVGGFLVEVLFAPEDRVAGRLTDLLESAEQSIYFLAFNITLDSLAQALIDRAGAGVSVQGVLEASQADSPGSDLGTLRRSGILVMLDGNPAKMHHKVIIIDRRIVITGSYNFSRSAEERNDENVLILHSPEVASQYLIEFDRIMSGATE